MYSYLSAPLLCYRSGYFVFADYVLASEIVVTVVAVVGLILAREPALAFPNVALTLCLFDNRHPGVNEDKDSQTDDPLNGDKDQVDPTQQ